MVLLRPHPRGRRVPPRVVRILSAGQSRRVKFRSNATLGSTSPPRSFPRRTRRQRARPVPLVSVPEARVPTVRPAPTARSTGRRRVRLASSGHSSPVSAVVLPGSRALPCTLCARVSPTLWRQRGYRSGVAAGSAGRPRHYSYTGGCRHVLLPLVCCR